MKLFPYPDLIQEYRASCSHGHSTKQYDKGEKLQQCLKQQ